MNPKHWKKRLRLNSYKTVFTSDGVGTPGSSVTPDSEKARKIPANLTRHHLRGHVQVRHERRLKKAQSYMKKEDHVKGNRDNVLVQVGHKCLASKK